jgi:cytoskeletal protein CcmA (bactofilin family)
MSQEIKTPSLGSFERAARLGATVIFQGEFSAKEDIVIQGQVKGKINLAECDLLVAEQGKVEAEVLVRNITVRGEVSGNITASGKITIEKTGRMKGDLAAGVISIEDGAQFRGSVKILGKK